MIRSYFGLSQNPFSSENVMLLPHQQEIYDILHVHSQQGGLCLLMGEPGTGKSVVKETIQQNASKRITVVSISRTLHTYTNIVKILCEAFKIDFEGLAFKCEKRLIQEAFSLNRQGKLIVTIIDDAHLMEMETLRKLRLLFEDFPKNHNIILSGQPSLISNMSLKVNDDIKSRVTFSTMMPKLNSDQISEFILKQLDIAELGHNTFNDDALALIIRSSEGIIRKSRNLCLSTLLETVRLRKRIVDLETVNRVLIQPHWRTQTDFD
jgi:type II secretory pathway predicted ATPase ExeA